MLALQPSSCEVQLCKTFELLTDRGLTSAFKLPTTKSPWHPLISPRLLRRLSLQVLRDETRAALATLLFCLNPATVFYSGVYTEPVFAMLSLLALNLLSTHSLVAATVFGLSTAARSNGIVSACFIAHHGIRKGLRTSGKGLPLPIMLSQAALLSHFNANDATSDAFECTHLSCGVRLGS